MCERKTIQQKNECNAGQGCCVYRKPDTVPYCDKGNHKESSLYHAPQHRKHWKKVERENSAR